MAISQTSNGVNVVDQHGYVLLFLHYVLLSISTLRYAEKHMNMFSSRCRTYIITSCYVFETSSMWFIFKAFLR